MRKILMFIIAFGLASSVLALNISVGGGGFFDSNFGGGYSVEVPVPYQVDYKLTMSYSGGGVNVFFDAEYAEISVGCMLASERLKDEDKFLGKQLFISWNFGLLAKYPVSSSDGMKLFPAAGIDYERRISVDKKMSRLWFKFGTGADFYLSKKMYLRSTLLYGVGLKSEYEDDLIKEWNVFDEPVKADVNLSHGLTVKIGVGFKLGNP